MTETAEVLHHVPGRLRLRLAFAKGNSARLEVIRNGLAPLAGVLRVDASPLLGTMLIRYDPALFEEFQGALEAYAADHGLFTLACEDSEECVSEADRSISRALGGLNRSVQKATGNAINLKELFPLAAGLYGFFLVDKTAAAAQWLNWLQFAFDTYIDLHEEHPITELGQKVDHVGAQILERQDSAADSVRAELAALRVELQRLAARLPEPQVP
ncbi:MAG TPA: hypothetical protein VJ732_12580 [Bryobacteraceae bacterium]|nr:hypothetical protein [Bryobacteraceae bacterium]